VVDERLSGAALLPFVRAGREVERTREELVIDVRGKPRRARVVKKPIYRKET